MPSKVLVTSGITAGHREWIDQGVMRIGSDSNCAMVVPSLQLAPHAGTLEYRNRQYLAHNKSRVQQQLNGRPLEPNASAVWQPGQPWSLAPDVVLVLEVEGDPAPCPEPTGMPDELDLDAPTSPTADANAKAAANAGQAEKKQSNMLQIVVILLCVVGAVGLLLKDRFGGKKETRNIVTFDKLVTTENQEVMKDEVRMLQYARSLRLRGRNEEAREWFRKLRDRLLSRQAKDPENDVGKEMRDYVGAQLEQK